MGTTRKLHKMAMKTIFLPGWIIFCLAPSGAYAQPDAQPPVRNIQLDPVVIRDFRTTDINKFIRLVKEDESFFSSFANMRYQNYTAYNDIRLFDKNSRQVAGYTSTTRQHWDGQCRSMDIVKEKINGNFYKDIKDREHRYYTAAMFDRVLFTHGTICTGDSTVFKRKNKTGVVQKQIDQLKTLIFRPGKKVSGIPFIGDKTAIFSKEMAKYYDFKVTIEPFEGRKDCYLFTATVKPEFLKKQQDATVVKYMQTWFDVETYQVVGRKYRLQYDGLFFSFDITLNAELTHVAGQYLPLYIAYDGWWDIPGRSPESADFMVMFFY